jgi:hypothetical protein
MQSGDTFANRLSNAVIMKAKQAQIFANFDFDPDVTAKWTKMVEDWDKDHSQPDPYEEPKSGIHISMTGFV